MHPYKMVKFGISNPEKLILLLHIEVSNSYFVGFLL